MTEDRATELHEYIKANPEIDVEEMARGMGWNWHAVEEALDVLDDGGLVERVGISESDDPLWAIAQST
jgi:Mn-dependent DtxR family transcriptional regulator